MKPDPDLGWVLNRSNRLLGSKHTHHKFDYTVNKDGFRNRIDFASPRPNSEKRRIMLLGDSFVFGLYLPESATLSSILGRKLGEDYEVFNLGVSGWGIDQMLLAYKKFRDLIRPDIVILVYIDNDLHRAMQAYRRYEGVNKPSFGVKASRLTLREASKPAMLERLTHQSLVLNKLFRRFHIRPKLVHLSKAIFSELMVLTTQRGEQLIILRYPLKDQIEEKKRPAHLDLNDFFEDKPVIYVDPYESMLGWPERVQFYLSHDAHPARLGNEFVADHIINDASLGIVSQRRDTTEVAPMSGVKTIKFVQ